MGPRLQLTCFKLRKVDHLGPFVVPLVCALWSLCLCLLCPPRPLVFVVFLASLVFLVFLACGVLATCVLLFVFVRTHQLRSSGSDCCQTPPFSHLVLRHAGRANALAARLRPNGQLDRPAETQLRPGDNSSITGRLLPGAGGSERRLLASD